MDNPIDLAVAEFDSLSDMSRRLTKERGQDVSYQLIQDWRKKGRVPAPYCPLIEKLTNGKVRCEQLNDEVDWAYLRSTAAA